MLGWFELHLKGAGTGASKKDKEISVLPAEHLMTFSAGERDANVITTEAFCKTAGNDLRKDFLNKKTFDAAEKRLQLKNVLRINGQSALKTVHRFSDQDTWMRYSLATTDGKMIPLLVKPGSLKSGKFTIVSHADGKQQIPAELIDQLIAKGEGIAIADLSGTGEAISTFALARDHPGKLHTLSRSVIWLGKTMLGEWVKELETVSRYLQTQFKATEIQIDGTREAGLAALFLAAINPQLTQGLILRDIPSSYLFDTRIGVDYFSMAVHVPGILIWGDISLAMALTGRNIQLVNPVTISGNPLTGSLFQEYQSEFVKMKKASGQRGKLSFD
jgi:hypothetical protein